MDVDWLRARAEWQPSESLRASLVLFGNREDRYYRNAEVNTWQPATGLIRRSDYLEISHDQKLRGAVADLVWTHRLFGREHQLVFGLQADRNDHDRGSDSPFRFNDAIDLLDPVRGVYTSLDAFLPRTATDIEQRSVFVESALDLAPRWRLISGLRHDRSEVDSLNVVSGLRFDKRYSAGSYRLGLSFSPSEQTTLYGSLATSSEAPAQITTLGLANANFDLTDSGQVELGIKHSSEHIDWTLAVYDISRTNLLSRDPEDPNRLIQVGEQAARGIEASLRMPLGERLRVEASAAVLDAKFERFDEVVSGVAVSRRGNDPVAVPERIGTLWTYFSASQNLELGLGLRGVGASAANTANTLYLPGYATVDALLRYDAPIGRISLRLRNLDDRIYATRPYGAGQFMLGEPRWYELTWQRSF
jgi:iron complex outermembrane receptor protein